jgi:hypothetical protein
MARFVKLPDQAINEYLNGRPRDPRVKYATGITRGKVYRTKAQKEALVEAIKDKVAVVDEAAYVDHTKPALSEA